MNALTTHSFTGQEVAHSLQTAFDAHSLGICFNMDHREFSVLGSSNVQKVLIEDILRGESNPGWHLRLLDTADRAGNWVIRPKRTFQSLFDRSAPIANPRRQPRDVYFGLGLEKNQSYPVMSNLVLNLSLLLTKINNL